ncbi:MAG: BamA/TamA family outer membrane protein [Nitrospiraceae bacterium]
MILRRLAVLLLVLIVEQALTVAPPASAEVKVIPVPAVGTSKNDGSDGGLILPILITEPGGDLRYIVAPLLIRNSIVGTRGAINVFRYDTGGRELRFIGSLTEKIERRIQLSYIDPAFQNGRYSFSLGGAFFKNATARFFGMTQQTVEGDQTNYTDREIRLNWKFGVYFNEVTQLAFGQRFRDVRIQRGATDLPFTVQKFPTVDGMDGSTVFGNRITFHYDTRDNLVTPTDGSQVTAYAEFNQNYRSGDRPVFQRYELELKTLIPSPSKHLILVVRADLQMTFGDRVPFYEQSSLGGQNNLRGYGIDRFIDKHLVSLSVEQRIHVFRTRITNVAADFEIAPFVDTGKVFSSFTKRINRDYEITPGIGFRGTVRPNVVGRVDWGYSKEGGAVFAGLDFPF